MALVLHFSDQAGLAVVEQVRATLSLLSQNLHKDQGINEIQGIKLDGFNVPTDI